MNIGDEVEFRLGVRADEKGSQRSGSGGGRMNLLLHLVVLAALELRKEAAQNVQLEMLLERKRLRMVSSLDNNKVKRKR